MIAYKLFRINKNGGLSPLFINRKQEIPIGEWLQAEYHPTKGFKIRQGFHLTLKSEAPHLKTLLKSGEVRVWCKVEVEDYEYHERPVSQSGLWVLAQRMRVIERLL